MDSPVDERILRGRLCNVLERRTPVLPARAPLARTFHTRCSRRRKAQGSPPARSTLQTSPVTDQEFHPLKSVKNCLDNGKSLTRQRSDLRPREAPMGLHRVLPCFLEFVTRNLEKSNRSIAGRFIHSTHVPNRVSIPATNRIAGDFPAQLPPRPQGFTERLYGSRRA